jgi:23S rRNA (uracil1939-C5)-methyltransferase
MPLSVRFGDISVPFPAGSFLQASASGEENLIAFAKNAAQGANKILDLFCGLGGFGLSMISAKTRHFADLDGPAVTSLERAVRGDAHKKVMQRNLIREPFTPYELNAFDAVIFDPPRGGAKAQVSQLALSSVKKIVAISCDPPSFARDAKLIASGGYKLESLQMTDQFLWSPHCELAASFSRD